MPPTIDTEQVRKIARLARLRLTDAEAEQFSGQLSRILEYVDLLAEAPLDGVEPLAHPTPLANVLRADEPRPGLSTEEALQNAPQPDAVFFRVPAVIDGASGA